MMKTLRLLPILLVLVACEKDDPKTPDGSNNGNNGNNNAKIENYWGCWKHTTEPQAFDIILTEDTLDNGTFQFGVNCAPQPIVLNTTFRNDTVIIDNGIAVYWCFIQGDSMAYSAYQPGATTEYYKK